MSARLSASQLFKAGGAAIVAAVLANLAGRFLLGAVISLDPAFTPFTLGPIVMFTTVFTLIGVGVLAVVNALAAQPLKVYNVIGVIALGVSILPNLAGAANPAAMPMGGAGPDYLILITFHVIAAAAFLGTLNVMARRR